MLRRANDHEAAAFYLVERTIRRTRPQVGPLGLKAFETGDGKVERDSLGRLRFRFDGKGSDFQPENGYDYRPLSDEELSTWQGLRKLVSSAKPVADPDWNLVSMRLGPRILRRLPMGGVVAFVPNGTPPFMGSVTVVPPKPEPELTVNREMELLRAIDDFLREPDLFPVKDPNAGPEWRLPKPTARQTNHILWSTMGHGRGRGRGKWYKCPLCKTPVVRGPFNPRIPVGSIRPGVGAIRDLHGGYLQRLHETYLIGDPTSLLSPTASLPRQRAQGMPPIDDVDPSVR